MNVQEEVEINRCCRISNEKIDIIDSDEEDNGHESDASAFNEPCVGDSALDDIRFVELQREIKLENELQPENEEVHSEEKVDIAVEPNRGQKYMGQGKG